MAQMFMFMRGSLRLLNSIGAAVSARKPRTQCSYFPILNFPEEWQWGANAMALREQGSEFFWPIPKRRTELMCERLRSLWQKGFEQQTEMGNKIGRERNCRRSLARIVAQCAPWLAALEICITEARKLHDCLQGFTLFDLLQQLRS